jgi:Tol biopolymer transport system component
MPNRILLPALAIVGLASVALSGDVSPRTRQGPSEQEVSTIEPRFTRVFGSDSLAMYQPSISPNGRWLAFAEWEGARPGRQNLWIVSVDGGEAFRLTEGDHWDAMPRWFPSSDRIAFRSSRVDGDIMTMPVDPATGRTTGPPRQVTFGCFAWFDISPDGKWIAYVGEPWDDRGLYIVPAAGGTARLLVQDDMSIPFWESDGRYLYYPVSRSDTPLEALMQVPVAGGTPDTALTWPGRMWVMRDAEGAFVLRQIHGGPAEPERFDIATLEGESFGRFELPHGMKLRWQGRGREVLTTMDDATSPLKVLSLEGGAARQITESTSRDQPIGWTPDGALLFATELDGHEVLLLAHPPGGPGQEIKLPDRRLESYNPVLSADGRYVAYAVSGESDEKSVLKALDIESGEAWVLSKSHLTARWGVSITGRGGTYGRDGSEFLYVEKTDEGYELRATLPRGPSRLLWSFGKDELPGTIAVHGDRLILGGSLRFAVAGGREAQRLANPDSVFGGEASWSHDGRWIATYAWPDTSSGPTKLGLIEVSPRGEVVGERRILEVGATSWWSANWLPDDSGVLLVGQTTGMDGDVWLIPVKDDAPPVALTLDETYPMWDYALSPDGRQIAYSIQIPRGGSIWRVDISDAFDK